MLIIEHQTPQKGKNPSKSTKPEHNRPSAADVLNLPPHPLYSVSSLDDLRKQDALRWLASALNHIEADLGLLGSDIAESGRCDRSMHLLEQLDSAFYYVSRSRESLECPMRYHAFAFELAAEAIRALGAHLPEENHQMIRIRHAVALVRQLIPLCCPEADLGSV